MSGLVYLLETRFEQRFSILFIFDSAVKSFYVVFFFKLEAFCLIYGEEVIKTGALILIFVAQC